MRHLAAALVAGALATALSGAAVAADAELGARVYNQRCVLCHGGKGMGEGFLPLRVHDYPNTNLRESDNLDLAVIERAIRTGSVSGESSVYSPPWADELNDEEIASLARFVRLLRTDVESAITLLDATHDDGVRADGANIYATRCVLCHGATGEGNGKMAKVIKSPPPFNLTLSRMPPAYLSEIISKGGEALMRSPKMPPWGEELSKAEIAAVVGYIMTFRRTELSAK